jgi:hypothetical protein
VILNDISNENILWCLLNGQAIYSLETLFENCTKFPDEINEKVFKNQIEKMIITDGLSPNDFKLGFLTKEQYDNRHNIDTERVVKYEIKKRGRKND